MKKTYAEALGKRHKEIHKKEMHEPINSGLTKEKLLKLYDALVIPHKTELDDDYGIGGDQYQIGPEKFVDLGINLQDLKGLSPVIMDTSAELPITISSKEGYPNIVQERVHVFNKGALKKLIDSMPSTPRDAASLGSVRW